jgi:hypothetical protein
VIIKKFKNKGFSWAINAIIREWKMPNHPLTKRSVIAIKTLFTKPYRLFYSVKNDTIIGIYDLNINPVSYDFAYFMCGIQSMAKVCKAEKFYLYIIKKNSKTSQDHEEYRKVVNEELIAWKLNNIVIPIISLFKECYGYAIINQSSDVDFKDAITYPHDYSNFIKTRFEYTSFYSSVDSQNFLGLQAPKAGKDYINKLFKSHGLDEKCYGKVVTISLREYAFDTARNSNINEWVRFARKIKEDGYIPVFIPDIDRNNWNTCELKEFLVFTEASFSINLRASLYELAHLNLFVNSGVLNLAILNKNVSYIAFKLVNEESHGAKSSYWTNAGLEIGLRHFPFANKRQILVWGIDDFDLIYSEFKKFQTLNAI